AGSRVGGPRGGGRRHPESRQTEGCGESEVDRKRLRGAEMDRDPREGLRMETEGQTERWASDREGQGEERCRGTRQSCRAHVPPSEPLAHSPVQGWPPSHSNPGGQALENSTPTLPVLLGCPGSAEIILYWCLPRSPKETPRTGWTVPGSSPSQPCPSPLAKKCPESSGISGDLPEGQGQAGVRSP
ncbi:hypothetical protein H1C71_007656, partial [Ictidomys tridecemlineatus]